MRSGEGRLVEVFYDANRAAGRIACPPALVPSPGRYVLAASEDQARMPDVVPTALFQAGSAPEGFLVASAFPLEWRAGTALALRGPLGQGFGITAAARRVALVDWEGSPACLLPLVELALAQEAEVALVSSSPPSGLHREIEVQPLAALEETCAWADYVAIDLSHDSLPALRDRLGRRQGIEGQALVHAPMPCGALAECGVCAVTFRRGWKMACKDGPVFDLSELLRM